MLIELADGVWGDHNLFPHNDGFKVSQAVNKVDA